MIGRSNRNDVDRRIFDNPLIILISLALIGEVSGKSFREGKIDVGAGDDGSKFARFPTDEGSPSVEILVAVPDSGAILAHADRSNLKFFYRALFLDGLFARI